MTDISHLPTPGVVFDADAAERDEAEIEAPFIAKIGDRNITFADPATLDWLDLAAVQIPSDLIRISLEREDREHLLKTNLPGWKFNKLMAAYYTHYNLEDKIRDAKRQASFGK